MRIFSSESVIVTGPHGSIVSESIADRRSGLTKNDLNVAPALSAKSAIDSVVRAIAPGAAHTAPPKAELIIYPVMRDVRVAAAANKAEAALNATDLEEVVDSYQQQPVQRRRADQHHAQRQHLFDEGHHPRHRRRLRA